MKIQTNKDLRLMRLWKQIAAISWKNKLWSGWGIILIIGTFISLIILPAKTDFHTPLDIDTISMQGDENALAVLDDSNHITIFGSNRTIQQHILVNRINNTDIDASDIEFLPDNLLAIADLEHDCIWVVNQTNISDVIWTWNAHSIDDVNWSQFGSTQYWNHETLVKVQSLVDQPSNSFGLRDITFSPRSLRSRTFDSFLITLQQLNMVIEVSFTEEKSLIWAYGNPIRTEMLKLPQSCKIMSTGDVLITDSGNFRCIIVNYSNQGIKWFYKKQFPNGDLLVLRDAIEIQPLQIALIDRSCPGIDIIAYSNKSTLFKLRGSLLATPIDIVDRNGSFFIADSFQNLILEYKFEPYRMRVYWGSLYMRGYVLFLLAITIVIHIGLITMQILDIGKKNIRRREGILITGGYIALISMCFTLIYLLPYIFTQIGAILYE